MAIFGEKETKGKEKAREKAKEESQMEGGDIPVLMTATADEKEAGSGLCLCRAAGAKVIWGGQSLACDPPLHLHCFRCIQNSSKHFIHSTRCALQVSIVIQARCVREV